MKTRGKLYLSIFLIPLLGGMAARLLRVVIAFFLRDLGATVFEISILASVFMLTRGIFSPIVGRIADRGASRILIVLVGFAGLCIDSLLYPHVPYSLMILLRAMDGFYGAMVWPTMQAFVHFSSPKHLRGRLMSSYYIMGGLGGSVGYILYNALLGNVKNAVITVAVFYFLGGVLSLHFKDLKEDEIKEVKETKRAGIPLYTLSFLYGMLFALGSEVLLFYLAEIMTLGRELTTLLLSVASMLSLLGTFLVGYVSDRKSFSHAFWLLSIFTLLAGFLIMVDNRVVAIFGTILFFIGGRGFLPISRSFAASTTKNVGTSIGFLNLTSNIGSVISPLIGGALLDYFRYSHVFIFNLSALLFFLLSLAILGNTYLLYYGESHSLSEKLNHQ